MQNLHADGKIFKRLFEKSIVKCVNKLNSLSVGHVSGLSLTRWRNSRSITRGNYWPCEWRSAAKYEVEPCRRFHITSLPKKKKKLTITTCMRISCNAKLQVSATFSIKAPSNDQTFNMQFLCSKTFITKEAHPARTAIPNLYSAGVTQTAPRFQSFTGSLAAPARGWLHYCCRWEANYLWNKRVYWRKKYEFIDSDYWGHNRLPGRFRKIAKREY